MSGSMNDPGAPPPDMSSTAQNVTDQDRTSKIVREPPDPPEQRRQLVTRWNQRVERARRLMEPTFRRMRRNMDFAMGKQWDSVSYQFQDDRYVANIALRHVQQRTASLYANNPTIVAKKRERLLAAVWDGDWATYQAAQAMMQQITMISQAQGVPPTTLPGSVNAAAIMADFKNVDSYNRMLDRICKTLEILYNYEIEAQTFPFKTMMKHTVRRAIVTGVGYVKLGFQRALKMRPELEMRIADMSERLAHIERLAADLADNEIPQESAEAEELRLAIQAMQQEPKLIVREGLLFDYPDSTSIIPDPKCRNLRGFLGADWVAQEYYLTVDEIQEVYQVDVGYGHRAYSRNEIITGSNTNSVAESQHPSIPGLLPDTQETLACVWEIYHRKDGLIYVVCDGYKDFLQEPAAPEVYNDDFWPWYPLVLNESYHESEIFPQSDIDLLRDMQLELNRARQGLREHRRANRPKIAVAGGILEDEDKLKLQTHPANALLELNALSPGQKIEDVLQPVKMPPIDPALYETNQTFEDLLRVLGQDQASMGDAQNVTATEAAVADASRHTDLSSVIDDQDDLLSQMAMAAGKILLLNVSAETVQEVVGPGAVWPELTKEDVAKNVYLTVKAGSTGRPNKQQEVSNAQIIFPMLQRIPGISPEWMARELIKRLDDHLDLTDAFVAGVPSMDALNRLPGGTVQAPEPQDPMNPMIVSGQLQPGMQAGPGSSTPTGMPVPGASAPPGGGAPPGAPPGGPPGAAPPGPPGGPPGPPPGPPGGTPPGVPPMAGPNDPRVQGPAGGQNAPAINPVNGMLGARTPPVPGVSGVMPGKRMLRGGLPMP